MTMAYNPYAAAVPAYAPYARPYTPPQYPLVSLVGQGPGGAMTPPVVQQPPALPIGNAPAPASGIMGTLQKLGPLNIPYWAWLLGSLGLGTVAVLHSSGAFEGGRGAAAGGTRRSGARRDFSFLFDGGGGRSRSRSRSRKRSSSSRRTSARRRTGGRRDAGFLLDGGGNGGSSGSRTAGRSSGASRSRSRSGGSSGAGSNGRDFFLFDGGNGSRGRSGASRGRSGGGRRDFGFFDF